MADKGDSTDLMMKFVRENAGLAIPAECRTEFDPKGDPYNNLLDGFEKKSMFEVDRFTFAAGIEEGSVAAAAKQNKSKDKKPGAGGAGRSTMGEFQAWRSGTLGNKKYPVDIQPITFTRQIDQASTTLLQACIDREVFKSATLIKRRGAGGATTGKVYLRIDFLDVLIIDIEWSDDDQVTETCKFICRSVNVQYRPQLPDGSLGASVPGSWSVDGNQQG
jgi:type VI protein secretion system component Hcp